MTSRGAQSVVFVNKRQRRWCTTAVRLNSARFQATIYSTHRVSRVPHLRVRQRFVAVICSGYCSVIPRFRFFLFFLLHSPFRVKEHHALAINLAGNWSALSPVWETLWRNWYTYPTKDHARVEGLRWRIDGVPSCRLDPWITWRYLVTSRSPVFFRSARRIVRCTPTRIRIFMQICSLGDVCD